MAAYSKSVAPQKPFFIVLRPARRTPTSCAEGVERQVQGSIRCRLGQSARGDLPAAVEDGHHPAGTELTPRPDWVRRVGLPLPDQKNLYPRLMETFAGYLAFTDHECGRADRRHQSTARRRQHDDPLHRRRQRREFRRRTSTARHQRGEPAMASARPWKTLQHLDESAVRTPSRTIRSVGPGPVIAPFQWVKQVASHPGRHTKSHGGVLARADQGQAASAPSSRT